MNPADEMIGQFLLAREEVPALASWPRQQIGNWILHWHPRLPVSEIRSRNGGQVGWLMGLAIDTDDRPIGPVWPLPFDGEDLQAADQFESKVNSLGGRFAAVFVSRESSRFYLDASGSLAAVYCKDRPVVASSCNLVPQIEDLGQNDALVKAFGVPQRRGYFPFGLTPWPGLSRLMPNHYLDLDRWCAKRHWPNGTRFQTTENPEATIGEVARLLRGFISGVAQVAPIQLTITGGHDSRALVACSRSNLSSIRLITTQLPDIEARIDCAYGRRIADRFGLDYAVLLWKEASSAEIEGWLYRTGRCMMDRITTCVRTDEQLDPARITLLGIGGEVGQGYYWTRPYDLTNPLTCDEIVRRFRLPSLDIVAQAASNWLDGLPVCDDFEKLDLYFIEQRLGCWAGPAMYGSVQARFVTYPHNSRRIFETMLSMPHDYRREGRLPIDMIRLQWPELLQMPFNQPFGWLKLEYEGRRILRNMRTKLGNAGARKLKSVLARRFREAK